MGSDKIYLVPEIHHENPFSFIRDCERITLKPVLIEGFCLWARLDCLDSYATTFTVITVPHEGSSAKMYPIHFLNEVPDFEKYGFSLKSCPHGMIVYMETDVFWKFNSKIPCTLVGSVDWSSQKSYFRSVAALYHLGILQSIIPQNSGFDSRLEEATTELHVQFNVKGDLPNSLAEIFMNTYNALKIFGFCETSSPENQQKLKHLETILAKNDKYPFGQIDFAITKYNETCYHMPEGRHDIMTSGNYHELMASLETIKRFLTELGYITEYSISLLTQGIKKFQSDYQIPSDGICNSATIRRLWECTVSRSVATESHVAAVGLPPPQYAEEDRSKRFIENEPGDHRATMLIADRANRSIGALPQTEAAEEHLRARVASELGGLAMRCSALNQRVAATALRADATLRTLEAACRANARCEAQLDEATTVLMRVLDDHSQVQKQFVEIREHVSAQRLRNRILTIIGVFILAVYIWKYIQRFK